MLLFRFPFQNSVLEMHFYESKSNLISACPTKKLLPINPTGLKNKLSYWLKLEDAILSHLTRGLLTRTPPGTFCEHDVKL